MDQSVAHGTALSPCSTETCRMTSAPPKTSTAPFEKELASIGFFLPSAKRTRGGRERVVRVSRIIAGRRFDSRVRIIPSSRFGHPTAWDQDRYVALMKIADDLRLRHGKLHNPLPFRSSELLRILERHSMGGLEYRRIREWLDVMTETTVISTCGSVLPGYTPETARYRVFEHASPSGTLKDGNHLAHIHVWLSGWQIENINSNRILTLDLDAYLRLRSHIARVFLPILHIWLYASRHRSSFEKRYRDLCALWNLRYQRSRSKVRSQLGPALEELVTAGYVAGWDLRATARGHKLVLLHGNRYQLAHKQAVESISSRTARLLTHPYSIRVPQGIDDRTPEPLLLDEMRRRGIPERAARELLGLVSDSQPVLDQLEWGDSIIEQDSQIRNPVGFYIHLIRDDIHPPKAFKSTRKRKALEQMIATRELAARRRAELELEYDACRQQAIERHIRENLGDGGFRELVEQKKSELLERHPRMRAWEHSVFDRLAESTVKSDIESELRLPSFEQFVASPDCTSEAAESRTPGRCVPSARRSPNLPSEEIRESE